MSNQRSSRKRSTTMEGLTEHRRVLKVRLWNERQQRLKTGAYHWVAPICDYCGEPIRYPDQVVMHEWLIKRSALPLSMQVAIMHEFNCVLVHFNCHDRHGQTREFKLACARDQYRRYGRDTIVAWVDSLGLKQYIEIPEESEAT